MVDEQLRAIGRQLAASPVANEVGVWRDRRGQLRVIVRDRLQDVDAVAGMVERMVHELGS